MTQNNRASIHVGDGIVGVSGSRGVWGSCCVLGIRVLGQHRSTFKPSWPAVWKPVYHCCIFHLQYQNVCGRRQPRGWAGAGTSTVIVDVRVWASAYDFLYDTVNVVPNTSKTRSNNRFDRQVQRNLTVSNQAARCYPSSFSSWSVMTSTSLIRIRHIWLAEPHLSLASGLGRWEVSSLRYYYLAQLIQQLPCRMRRATRFIHIPERPASFAILNGYHHHQLTSINCKPIRTQRTVC